LLSILLASFLSQYFFAASQHHPIMYLAVQQTLMRVMTQDDVGDQYVPFVTGPGALKVAMILFMGKPGTADPNHHKPPPGLYHGHGNHTVTVVEKNLIRRSIISNRRKKLAWDAMNMTDYNSLRKKSGVSCLEKLYVEHDKRHSS
jgi:hypothetical protein